VLAAVDDAHIATAVVDRAHVLARLFGARLTAMHALSDALDAQGGRWEQVRRTVTPQQMATTAAVRHAARTWLREHLQRCGADAASSDVAVTTGDAGPSILAEAHRSGAELIVLGRWGAHALGHAGTGAVTRFVLRGARCPVVVVTDGGTAPDPHWNRRFQHALRIPPRATQLRWTNDGGEGPPAA
jgi:nucleotide-binding universal stress UspA family protein